MLLIFVRSHPNCLRQQWDVQGYVGEVWSSSTFSLRFFIVPGILKCLSSINIKGLFTDDATIIWHSKDNNELNNLTADLDRVKK